MELKRVVVTGMGAITPIGNDVETAWENAKKECRVQVLSRISMLQSSKPSLPAK